MYWVEMQTAEGSRVAEAILPETDDDAVRIMTIHAAKGLEFPITIVSGMSTKPGGGYVPADVVFPPPVALRYRFGRYVRTEEWETWKPVDEQMNFDERIRLLYVACTRACDHLVVSLHRAERRNAPSPNTRTNAELLVDGMGALLDDIPDAVADDGATVPRCRCRRCRRRSCRWRSGRPSAMRHSREVPARRRSRRRRSPTKVRTIPRPISPPACRSVRATSTCRRG